MDNTKIEWTDATWNCLRGCSRVSEGCRNCYAERVAARFSGPGMAYEGLARMVKLVGPRDKNSEARWTGEVRLIEDALEAPLRWKRPRRIFVNSMSDLFHEKVTDEMLHRIFSVMFKASATNHNGHTFQILTKRPKRMLEWARRWTDSYGDPLAPNCPRIWWGVSVEDQATADERIPLLLQCPAAIRWVSAEPLIGRLALDEFWMHGNAYDGLDRIHWVVIGGESGIGARPFHLKWARSMIAQCRESSIPIFVKQLGACAIDEENGLAGAAVRVPSEAAPLVSKRLENKKGGDMAEWPEDLRVREYPERRG